jgi:hypothetical protein
MFPGSAYLRAAVGVIVTTRREISAGPPIVFGLSEAEDCRDHRT